MPRRACPMEEWKACVSKVRALVVVPVPLAAPIIHSQAQAQAPLPPRPRPRNRVPPARPARGPRSLLLSPPPSSYPCVFPTATRVSIRLQLQPAPQQAVPPQRCSTKHSSSPLHSTAQYSTAQHSRDAGMRLTSPRETQTAHRQREQLGHPHLSCRTAACQSRDRQVSQTG